MADNDYSMVQPIEGLPNVLGITPAEQQQQQQRRKTPAKSRPPHSEPDQDEEKKTEISQENHPGNHLIDYRA